MTVRAALRHALRDMYEQSWRLVLLNTALRLRGARGARAGELRADRARARRRRRPARRGADALRCLARPGRRASAATRVEGVRLHWLRGLELGALAASSSLAGLVAVRIYARPARSRGRSRLSPPTCSRSSVFQLLLWPLAVAERERPLRRLLADAGTRSPGGRARRWGSALALLLINALGAVAAVLPLLTADGCVLVRRRRAVRAAAPTRGGPALMASVTFEHVPSASTPTRRRRPLARDRGRRVPRAGRPVRLRQEHGAANARRPRGRHETAAS